MIQLTLEQQFELAAFRKSIEDLSREDCQRLLVELYAKAIHQETRYVRLLGKTWGLTPPAES